MLSKPATMLLGLIYEKPLNAYEITKLLGYMNVRWWFNIADSTVYTTIKNLIKEINKIGVNINQIAKRTNETNRIYEDDIKELKGELEQVWQLLKSNLSSQH